MSRNRFASAKPVAAVLAALIALAARDARPAAAQTLSPDGLAAVQAQTLRCGVQRPLPLGAVGVQGHGGTGLTMVRTMAMQFSDWQKKTLFSDPESGIAWTEGDTWSVLMYTDDRPPSAMISRNSTQCDQDGDFVPAKIVLIIGRDDYTSDIIRMDLSGNVEKGVHVPGFFGPDWAGTSALSLGGSVQTLTLEDSRRLAGRHLAYFQDWYAYGEHPYVSQ